MHQHCIGLEVPCRLLFGNHHGGLEPSGSRTLQDAPRSIDATSYLPSVSPRLEIDSTTKVLESPCQSVTKSRVCFPCRHWPGEEPLKSRSGTPVFMAPEVIMQDYSHKADVWSVGILMYHMLTGRFPFWESVSNLSLQQVSPFGHHKPEQGSYYI